MRGNKNSIDYRKIIALLVVLIIAVFEGLSNSGSLQDIYQDVVEKPQVTSDAASEISQEDWYKNIPEYNGNPYTEINHNVPFFTKEDYKLSSDYVSISELDQLGRCGSAFVVLNDEDIPEEKRGDISRFKPSGWVQEKYSFNGKQLYLYNRSHLIAYSLFGMDDEKILITGTDYFNHDGMIPFETTVRDYIKSRENFGKRVLYRVTPVFEGNDLVCKGVLMEAASADDKGYAVSYNVFCYNVQPGVDIDYKTGNSKRSKNIVPNNYYK